MRRLVAGCALVVVAIAAPRAGPAQDRAVRFQITLVGDTTVAFRAGKETWVVRSPNAIVVDPRRRDALVARLKVLSVTSDGLATAVVTGQTGRITEEHTVIAEEPPQRWFRNLGLWVGVVLGTVAGFGLGRL